MADWTRALNRAEVIDTLLANRIPVAPVNDAAALLADPHLADRQDLLTVEDADIGPLTLVAPVPLLEGTPGAVRTTGPRLGAHNYEIYRDWLGLDDTTLKVLAAQGVV